MRTALAVVVLALLPAVPAFAAKPQPAPTITAIALCGWAGNPAMFAAASDGRILVASCPAWGCDVVQSFQEGARLPGKPVTMWSTGWVLFVCLENGDLYKSIDLNSIPFTFDLIQSVLGTAPGARFDLQPLNFAAPTAPTPPAGDPDSPDEFVTPGAEW